MSVDTEKKHFAYAKVGEIAEFRASDVAEDSRRNENIFSEITSELQIILTPKGKISKINEAVSSVFGWHAEELIGRQARKYIHHEDRDKVSRATRNILSTSISSCFEVRVKCKDGSLRWLSVRAKSDNEKGSTYFAAIDITNQKKSEIERDQLYDITSDILIVSNADGPFSRPNPTCERVLGWTPIEMTAHPWSHFVHPDDIERSRQTTEQLYSGTSVINFENRYKHKNGTYRWLNWRAKLDSENGRVYAGAMDITVRKEFERERERFFEVASDVLFITDYEGRCTKVSPACTRVLGWTPEEMTSNPRSFFVHPEDISQAAARLEILRTSNEILHFESRILHHDGTYRWISWRAKGDNEQNLIYYGGFDITEQKNLENRLRQQTQDLADSKRLADRSNSAKTEFLANMSHEIRTPMNAVIGLAHVLALSTPLTPKQKECINVLKASGDSLLYLINDLLDISKIESGKIVLEHRAFHVSELIHEVISMMGTRAQEKGLDLVFINECNHITERPFMGDPARIKQIVTNLCSNAIKFTEHGKIKLMVECESTEIANIENLLISVHDEGVGIAFDKLDTIFEKFVQADSSINRKYGGTGLGLSITKTLTEIMGGTILVSSKLGEGSVFTVRLPLERK